MLTCDHIALVVRKLEPVVARLEELGVNAGPIEDFPGEGTREVYLGDDAQPARLLLMQPLGADGPYALALDKRGPGLHHVAFHALDAQAFVGERPGWLLLPQSLDTWRECKTLWLARPGIGTLVEVHEGKARYSGDPLIERVELPVAEPSDAELLAGVSGTTVLARGAGALTLGGARVGIDALTS